MNFVDLDSSDIRNNSTDNGEFYEYIIGNPTEINCLKDNNSNKLISKNLSSKTIEDKFMIKYRPTNKVYFKKSYINSGNTKFASFKIDKENNMIFVGESGDYKAKDGILVFSGFLSANNMIESDRYIFGNSRVVDTIKQRVYILSIGVRNDMLYALYYVISGKGTAIGMKNSNFRGISVNTLKECDCSKYVKFTVKDWFDDAKIMEIN